LPGAPRRATGGTARPPVRRGAIATEAGTGTTGCNGALLPSPSGAPGAPQLAPGARAGLQAGSKIHAT
jgi:hypothetical protein